MRKIAPALCMIGLLAAVGVGCIDRQGQLSIYLTDDTALADLSASLGIQQVNVEVTEVAIRDAESGQYLTLAGGSATYELLGLEGRLSLLALADSLDRGTYDAVRLRFSESNSSVITSAGRKNQLQIEPGTVTVPVRVVVEEDMQSSVTLTFDTAASVSQKANGAWVLRPVVRFGADI